MDQVLPRRQEALRLHGHMAGNLHHPCCMRIRRHPGDMHFPCTGSDKEQDIIGCEPTQRPDLGGEEVGRDEHVQMRADELLPGGDGLALWRWCDAMALEDSAHGLGPDCVAQIGQCPHEAIVAPGAMLPHHAHHQGLDLLVGHGAARRRALRGPVTLLRHAFAVPAEPGVGLDDRGDFRQGVLPQLLAHLGEGLALAVVQPEAPLDLAASHAVLCRQGLVVPQQCPIDSSRDRC